jgi:hypothetical protein
VGSGLLFAISTNGRVDTLDDDDMAVECTSLADSC